MKNANALLFFVVCAIFIVACGDDSGTSARGMVSSSGEEALSSVESFSSADNLCSSSRERELSSCSGEIIPALSSAVVDLSSSIAESSSSANFFSSSGKANWALMNPEISYGELTDARDGQVYRTVEIGDQIWMAENLNYAYMPDTLSFCYNDSAEYCEKYGRLYTWSAAMDSAAIFSEDGKGCSVEQSGSPSCGKFPVRGICPEGWHFPSNNEWKTLERFVAKSLFDGSTDSVGYALKSRSGWRSYRSKDGNGSDAFGFCVLPAGTYSKNSIGKYSDFGSISTFITSSKARSSYSNYSGYYPVYRGIQYNSDGFWDELLGAFTLGSRAINIRCLKN